MGFIFPAVNCSRSVGIQDRFSSDSTNKPSRTEAFKFNSWIEFNIFLSFVCGVGKGPWIKGRSVAASRSSVKRGELLKERRSRKKLDFQYKQQLLRGGKKTATREKLGSVN